MIDVILAFALCFLILAHSCIATVNDTCTSATGTSLRTNKNKEHISVLVRGWLNVPHSYAVVNCFQLIHLIKNYGDKYNFYLLESEYYFSFWNNHRGLHYTREYNDLLNNHIQLYNNQPIDLEYRISYPHNITIDRQSHVPTPIVVFYIQTENFIEMSGFTVSDGSSSNITHDIASLKDYISNQGSLYLVTASPFSYNRGHELFFTNEYLLAYQQQQQHGVRQLKHTLITHGVDTSIFYRFSNSDDRLAFRRANNIDDDTILFINVGSMTDNKGIKTIILAMNSLIKSNVHNNFKLLMKCINIYFCELHFTENFDILEAQGYITSAESEILLNNYILFTDSTYTFEKLNELYNAGDAYLAPYMSEGFNLPLLEAISVGLPVFCTDNGASSVYVDAIKAYDKENEYIFTFELQKDFNNVHVHYANSVVLYNSIVNNYHKLGNRKRALRADEAVVSGDGYYASMRNAIRDNFSWDQVSHLLNDYFDQIVSQV